MNKNIEKLVALDAEIGKRMPGVMVVGFDPDSDWAEIIVSMRDRDGHIRPCTFLVGNVLAPDFLQEVEERLIRIYESAAQPDLYFLTSEFFPRYERPRWLRPVPAVLRDCPNG